MDLKIKGKIGVVASASRGLGRAVAESLAAEGADLAICSRDEKNIKNTAKEISGKYGVKVVPVKCDVTRKTDIENMRSVVEEEFGNCHMLFVNAGGPPPGTVEDFEGEDFRKALDLNLISSINLINTFLPFMKSQEWGRILACTSISVKQPLGGLALSNVSRAGVISYIKTLSDAVGKYNITANSIAPGYIMTGRVVQLLTDRSEKEDREYEEVKAEIEKLIPVGKIGSTEEFGAFSAFLLSEIASYITGVTYLIDGGMYRGTM
ncbi:MAG: SDR family oxidoreductase [Acidobacteriota bacterium]